MTSSIIHKTFRFRIYPGKPMAAKLESTLDLCRELYNAGLQERIEAWKLNRISISYYDQQNQLPELKKIRTDLNDVYAQVLRDALRRLDKAFAGFFRRAKRGEKAGFPRFRSASRFNSFCYPEAGKQGVLLEGSKLTLSKIGTVKIKLSRPIQGKLKTCTIKRECGKWYVIFVVETITEPLPTVNQAIGLDVGVHSFATLSDGTQIDNWKYYESAQKRLRVAQRRVARRKKGSSRRKKAALLLQKTYQKVFNRRNDFQHKLSTDLVRQYDTIVVEKLNIIRMSRGILAKQIHDASWSSFFDKLRYKAESAGRQFVEVNPNHTSQDCSGCGDRVKKKLSVRVHHCLKCGLILDRDHNAAINILALGLSVQALTYPVTESVA